MKRLRITLLPLVGGFIAVLGLFCLTAATAAPAHRADPVLPDRLEPSIVARVVTANRVVDLIRYRCGDNTVPGFTETRATIRVRLFEGDIPGPDASGSLAANCDGIPHLAALSLRDSDGDAHTMLDATFIGTLTQTYSEDSPPPHDTNSLFTTGLTEATLDNVN